MEPKARLDQSQIKRAPIFAELDAALAAREATSRKRENVSRSNDIRRDSAVTATSVDSGGSDPSIEPNAGGLNSDDSHVQVFVRMRPAEEDETVRIYIYNLPSDRFSTGCMEV